jgi:hypothetical protein
LANSTIRIPFFAAKPISTTMPICAYRLFDGDRQYAAATAGLSAELANQLREPRDILGYQQRLRSGERVFQIPILRPAFVEGDQGWSRADAAENLHFYALRPSEAKTSV